MEFKDRVAVIGGGSAGIGKATCMLLAQEGARIVMVARTQPRLGDALKDVLEVGGDAMAIQADIRNEQDVKRIFDTTIEKYGKVDIAVLLAHTGGPYPLKPAAELSLDEWNGVFLGNTVATFLCVREALKHMIPARSGAIVTFSSSAADVGLQERSAYSAAKAAVVAFTRTVAREVGRQNIRVNCISPAADTEGLRAGMSAQAERSGVDFDALYASIGDSTALGRIPTSEDVAHGVRFLLSDASRGMTGQTLDINCGSHMR
jgi:NAD(P)-dependent dehydrogenase (short-subunit alcohol dehydrogenase family)